MGPRLGPSGGLGARTGKEPPPPVRDAPRQALDASRRVTIPLPYALQVLRRLDWHGTPVQLRHLFRLTKNRREARAALFTHQLGWEVRLLVGSQLESVQTQVCRDQEEVLRTGEEWKAAMVEMGWQ